MKQIILPLVLSLMLLCSCGGRQNQQITCPTRPESTEREFLLADSTLNVELKSLEKSYADKLYPYKAQLLKRKELLKNGQGDKVLNQTAIDNLQESIDELENERDLLKWDIDKKIVDNAVSNAPSSWAAFDKVLDYASVIPREVLSSIYESLNKEDRQSEKGVLLNNHIEVKALLPGDVIPQFCCYDASGQIFNWKTIEGRKLIFVFDGINYMKPATRAILDNVLEKNRDSLVVLNFVRATSQSDLQSKVKARKLGDYTVISDFSGEASALKSELGITKIPTIFATDAQHKVLHRSVGLNRAALAKLYLQ